MLYYRNRTVIKIPRHFYYYFNESLYYGLLPILRGFLLNILLYFIIFFTIFSIVGAWYFKPDFLNFRLVGYGNLILLALTIVMIVYKYFLNVFSLRKFLYVTNINPYPEFNLLGLGLFFLTLITCIMCLYFADVKNAFVDKSINGIFIFITIILFFFFSSNNFVTFFILYELILLPSVLLTYMSSPNLRSRNVAFYFLLWTQFGSFLVLLGIIFLLSKTYSYSFSNLVNLTLSTGELHLITVLFFFGFGVKIPIWPFHFWLTKTHVEVNTSFSIFLSGVLVKTALYGLYKISALFLQPSIFFMFVVFVGILDSAIKIFSQIDLKKVVAYCTIFEMNIILLNFFFLSYTSYLFLLYFCILHTCLSFYFFFVVDCIYRRFNTRSVLAINNILNLYPTLGLFIILGVLLFNGLPLTLKFNLELVLFQKLLNFNVTYLLLFYLVQIVGIIFFTKIFFNTLFFTTSSKKLADLTLKEIIIFTSIIITIIMFSFI